MLNRIVVERNYLLWESVRLAWNGKGGVYWIGSVVEESKHGYLVAPNDLF